MSSLRLALKQSLEESGIVPAKMARDKERKRMEVEYRKKKLKQQQQQQQRRKPGDPPRKRGRPPKNRPPQEPPATQSEHNDVNDNHDDDSSEVEATFSSDEGFVGHEDSDSHREESSHHSANNNSHDGKREAENEDPVPIAIASTPANKVAAFPLKVTAVVPAKPDFDDDEEDEGYRNQDGEDVDDEEESQNSEKAARKKLQRKQESAANMIKRGWKKKKGIVDKRENHMVSSSSSTSSSVEPPVASAVPEEPEEPKNSSLPPPPSVKKIPKEPPMERNKKDTNTQKAKTVPAPSKELIEWMRTLPKKKMKRYVAPGLRVKVRFAARIKRDGKSIRKLKWYGGVVSKVGKDGSKIRIKYDDGTSEISPFPDPDIVVDDESNGQHECEADWFIPDPMEINPDETPSSPRVEKNLKRPSETSESYEEQPSITSPPVRPPKKMKRSMPLVKNEGGEVESKMVPNVASSVSPENNPPDPVEPRKIKKKHYNIHVVDAVNAKKEVVEEILSETQQIVDEQLSKPPVQQDVASEVVAPASVVVTDPANADDVEESQKSLAVSESVEPEPMPLENNNIPFEASPMDESESVTVSGVTASETAKSDIDTAVATTQPIKDLETSPVAEAEAPKLPMLTIRLSKHAPSAAEEMEVDDDKVVSPGKSQSSESAPFANDESGEDDDEEEDELAVERSIDAVPPVAQEEATRAISVDAETEKERRPSKRIYIKLDMDAVERNSATIEEEPACGAAEDGDSQQNMATEPSESTLGEKVDAALLTTVVPGVDDTDASSPPPMDEHVKVPAAVVSLSAKRHGKGMDRLDEVIKPRRLTPIRPIESPTPLSCEPLNVVAEAEVPKPHSATSDAILDIERHQVRVVSDESVKKVPILTSSKNSAFSKKESSSFSKKESPNSPVPSKAALRINMRELATVDDDESTDVAVPKQRGAKSSAPRVGRRAAQQANQRISAKQEALQEAIAKKKRKRDKAEGRKREDGDESESSEDDRQWVQCDNCRKWRLLPTKIEPSMLPKHWYCEMNTYDPKRSSCVAPEQTAVEYAKEKKRAKKRLRQRIESPEETEENATEEPTERREPKPESNKRILVRSPIPVKEKDHSLKAASKSEHEPEIKTKRSSPDSNVLGYRSPIPERETEHQKGEKRLPGLSAKKSRIAEAEAASSSDGALEVVKVRGRGRGRARIAKELDKDQEKPAGAKPSSQDTNEADNVEWVQCEKCDKWRKLPPHIAADDLPDVWYCSMNTWNPSSASCEAAEDKADGYTHELSIFGGSPSTNSNKLSYRNLIFGTGKKFNRPISERTRAMESLFAVPADDNDGYPTVMYANSCAFVPRAGLRGTTDSNNGNPANISFLDLMKHSSLWAELRGVGEKMNNYTFGTFGHPYQRRTSFESFTDEMKHSMKELVCQSLGSRTLAGHEVLVEAQCRQWENVPPAWSELRPYCTVEIVVSALVDLVKDGVVELVEEPGADRTSKDWIPRYRCVHMKSAEPAPAILTDEGTRVSRCIKISKPWKHAQANNQWMLYS